MQFVRMMDFGSKCQRELELMGCEVAVSQDFDECVRTARKIGKDKMSPMLSPSMHDFTEGTCFWLILLEGGDPIACVAAKLEQIGREPIASYWTRANRRQYGPDGVSSVSTLASKHLTGDLAYIGELFVSDKRKGNRKRLEAMLHYLHATIFCMWGVEYSYAFMRERDVQVGLSARYGFSRMLPAPQTWPAPPDGRQNTEWLVSTSREDFEHISGHSLPFNKGS